MKLRNVEEQDILTREAGRALSLIHAWLEGNPIEASGSGKSRICMMGFARAKAIAFIQLEKTARVLSRGRGRGFLVANLGVRDGRPTWSAPCLLQQSHTQSHTGLGVSWGSEVVTTCYLLHTPEAAEHFAAGKLVLGAEGHRSTEADGKTVLEEGLNWADKNTGEVTVFSVSEGEMLDVGLTAGIMKPAPENQAVYGEGRGARSILSGKVAAPVEFEPIYEVLDALVTQGGRALHHMQAAGVHVPPVYHSQTTTGSCH